MKTKHLLFCICSVLLLCGAFYYVAETIDQIATLEKEKQSLTDTNEMHRLTIIELEKTVGQSKEIISTLESELKGMKTNHAKLQLDVKNLQEALQKEQEKVITVSRNDSPTNSVKEFYVTATAYTPYCAGCSGVTATGIDVRKNPHMKLIAVDPSVIPLGTKVWVEGYGYAITGDTGGSIKGNKIDLLMPTKAEAFKWGRKKVLIKILG